ncbi:MAG: hypothetical protein NVS1B14_08680 [Vulcanimicrobiaceae bacterium]
MVGVAVVCIGGSIVALRVHAARSLTMRGVQASGAPTRGRVQPRSHFRNGDFEGARAPWALSALPECLIQQSVWRGKTVDAVMAHAPTGVAPVAAGRMLKYRNCTVAVRERDAIVRRGQDRFHIPPWSRFFAGGATLVLLRQDRGAELRIYTLSNL